MKEYEKIIKKLEEEQERARKRMFWFSWIIYMTTFFVVLEVIEIIKGLLK
jgi:uncharacterized membrane protein YhaH (DUF805 family)